MINFDDERIERLIKKNAVSLNISYVLFAVALVTAVIAAVLAKGAYTDGENLGWHLAALIVACVALAGFIITVAGFQVRVSRQLKHAVCEKMCEGLLAREDFFKGAGEIEFVAEYSDNCLTLSRKNYTGAITIDPSRLTTADALGSAGAKIEIDLKPLKAVPALYATVGTLLWQFLQAYYILNGVKVGVKRVFITDYTGKNPTTLPVFDDAVPAKNPEKLYFIKKGLIK